MQVYINRTLLYLPHKGVLDYYIVEFKLNFELFDVIKPH